MKKLIVAFCIIIIASLAAIPFVPAKEQEIATVSIDPPTLNIPTAWIGETIQVDIKVTNVNDLCGWSIPDLTFNSSVLNFTRLEEGSFLKGHANTIFAWKKTPPVLQDDVQNIACAFLENTTVSGSGVLATAIFKVLSTGTTQLTIGNATLHNNIQTALGTTITGIFETLNCTTTNGVLNLTNPPPPTPTPTPVIDSAASGFPTVWILLTVTILLVVVLALLFYHFKVVPSTRSKSISRKTKKKNR